MFERKRSSRGGGDDPGNWGHFDMSRFTPNPYAPPGKFTSAPDGQDSGSQGKLAWYDQVWLALPIGLVIVGGAIGGACGGAAWGINQKVFRATKNPVLRYVWTGLISVVAVVAYIVLAAAFFLAFARSG